MKRSKTIFIAILDWGLGHATRCVPIIRYLETQGCTLHIGSSGNSLLWLQWQFPLLKFHELPDYNIRYSRSLSQAFAVMMQWNKIRNTIRLENDALHKLVLQNTFDAIISDNRYGCYHKDIPSYILTHQLHLKLPLGLSYLSGIADNIIKSLLMPFNEVWIPDEVGNDNLGGDLSHPAFKTISYKYCGLLSRFENYFITEPIYDILVILSGPEPQRTELENIIVRQLNSLTPIKSCLVRGTTKSFTSFQAASHIQVINLAGEVQLKKLIEESRLIVCRSGYSSIMDLQHSGKKLLLIPTPGQTEQEYLAKHFNKQTGCLIQKQSEVQIQKALEASSCASLNWKVNEKIYPILERSLLQ